MPRVASYLAIVPLPALVAMALAALVGIVLLPRSKRLHWVLIVALPWLAIGQLPGLGLIQGVAKATTILAYLAVALAAWLHPGARARASKPAMAILALAIAAVVYVLTTRDLLLALALRFQWISLVLAALMLARATPNRIALERHIMAITVGLCIASLITTTGLITDPTHSFRAGFGRLSPYGSSPNQIGILFASTVPFAAYAAFNARSTHARIAFASMSVLFLGAVILTASRSSLIVATVSLIPAAVSLAKRPLLAFLALVTIIATLRILTIVTSDESKLDRLASYDTGRTELFENYLQYSFAKRPIFGLLETKHLSVISDDNLGTHPHNAYLALLYLGGLSYGIPMFALIGYILASAYKAWHHSFRISEHKLLTSTIVIVLLAGYAHGFVNGAIFYANASWPWLHTTIAFWLLSPNCLRESPPAKTESLAPAFTTATIQK